MSSVYYNENDPFAAEWLRQLIKAKQIPAGIVDERDIRDIRPTELVGFTQCHFFAGIGGWAYALRLAGWPDSRPVWTGSCPCQPFSAAGKGEGADDERHLWPAWFHLIEQRRPLVIFGEQVASKAGLGWLDLVQADLEGANYASAAVDLGAAGIGAPHIRQRLWFVAERLGNRSGQGLPERISDGRIQPEAMGSQQGKTAERGSDVNNLANTECDGLNRGRDTGTAWRNESTDGGINSGMADCDRNGRDKARISESTSGHDGFVGNGSTFEGQSSAGPTNGYWRDPDWLYCRDGKWRPVESGTFPLAHGVLGRVGKLRGYGNAIVPQVAEAVIRSYLDCF